MARRLWLWIPVLLAVVGACGGGTTRTLTARRVPQPVPTFFTGTLTTTTTTTAPPTTPAPTAPPPPPVTVPPEASMSQGEYDLISAGMEYAQVVTIVGGPGTLVSQRTERDQSPGLCAIDPSRCSSPTYSTVQDYRWLKDNGGQALITFKNGRVSAKTQS
jgi:hypothetical protein